MKRTVVIVASLTVVALILLVAACEKEKIVESTEYVHDVEYVELPPDTVYRADTIFSQDSITVHTTDTVRLFDTVVQVNNVYDTVLVHDTVVTVQHHYDTTVVTDTVLTIQCDPNEYLAVAALQYYCDPLVIDIVNQEFGLSDGWIFYLSTFQIDLTQQSSGVYDIYGYIDYWTPDWEGFYPLEYYWRLTYTGGDPANPNNWQMSDPAAAPTGHQPGVRFVADGRQVLKSLR